MIFEWDENKNLSNYEKHKVTFEDAATVFEDSFALYFYDDIHSINEDRFIIIGIAESIDRELYVCYCLRGKNDEITRIISARKATKSEIKLYEEGISL
ncbi:MAG: BrnT family toxin [Oscillospiraceae bacterium]|nr:BrnT family toxin [Oscillospiraceae bacterium]